MKASHQTFAHDAANLLGRKVGHSQHQFAHQFLRAVVLGDLRARLFDADLRAKIDLQHEGRIAGFGQRLGTEHAPDAQRRQPRTLTIAYTGPMEQQLLLRAIPAFRAHHPEVELRVRQLSMARIGAALEAGDCDIALAIPGEIPLQQMKHVTVMERPICAAVASSHPLAGKNSVTLPELTHFPVILLQAGANRRASSQIARWLMGLGWTKDALRFADTIEDQLLMINLNQGISFMPQGSYPVGIRLIPIVSDTPILHHTEAVMRQMTPLHLQFVEQLRQADMAERHP